MKIVESMIEENRKARFVLVESVAGTERWVVGGEVVIHGKNQKEKKRVKVLRLM